MEMETKILSDRQIARQYTGFRINALSIEKSKRTKNFYKGILELEFPSANNIDFDETKIDNFIINEGQIMFDYWYSQTTVKKLRAIINKAFKLMITTNLNKIEMINN